MAVQIHATAVLRSLNFLDRLYARKTVPDLDQAEGWPTFGQSHQLVEGMKALYSGFLASFLSGRKYADVVVGIDVNVFMAAPSGFPILRCWEISSVGKEPGTFPAAAAS